MNKTFCKFPFNGFQINTKGVRLCCRNPIFIKKTPSEFWNGQTIRSVRKSMKKGDLVSGCDKCYKQEHQNSISLRNHYNAKFKDLDGDEKFPSVLDLDFSNLCNLKCVMCDENSSSQWAKENNPSVVKNGVLSISKKQIDDLCTISTQLKHINVQGGEPSIIPEYNYYFEYLIRNDIAKNVEIDCITNLTNINNKFFDQLKKFKKVNLNISVDAYGNANNYIRYPSNFLQIEKNIKKLITSNFQINLQIAIQTLSMFNFYDFLNWIAKLNEEFKNKNRKLGLNMFRVLNPSIFDVFHAPVELKEYFISQIEKFKTKNKVNFDLKFNLELNNIKNNILLHENCLLDELKSFISINDKKRNINIIDFIPNFINFC